MKLKFQFFCVLAQLIVRTDLKINLNVLSNVRNISRLKLTCFGNIKVLLIASSLPFVESISRQRNNRIKQLKLSSSLYIRVLRFVAQMFADAARLSSRVSSNFAKFPRTISVNQTGSIGCSPQSGWRLTVTTTKGGNDVNQSVSTIHRWSEGEADQRSCSTLLAIFPATLNPEKSPFRLRFRLGLKLRPRAALYTRQRANSVLKYISHFEL